MDKNKVDRYFAANAKFFPNDKIALVRDKMEHCDDSRELMINSVKLKNATGVIIAGVFGGYFGVDRFMVGDIGLGLLKLFTFGVAGIMWIADWFVLPKKIKEMNYNKIMQIL